MDHGGEALNFQEFPPQIPIMNLTEASYDFCPILVVSKSS